MRRPARLAELPQPFVLGHRGSRTLAVENTLAAIDLAYQGGADGVEVDVRSCGSGEPVVIHDRTLARLTANRDRRPVAQVPAPELRTIELGVERGDATARIPTLAGVLEHCAERRLAIDVEMKRDVPDRLALVRSTARALRRARLSAPAWVSSFDPLMLAAFRPLAPRVEVGLLLERDGPTPAWLGLLLGAAASHPERTMTSSATLPALRAGGRAVIPWTVNDPTEIADLGRLGVDGIISDDPGAAVQLLRELGMRRRRGGRGR